MPLLFTIEQIALCPRDPAAAKKLLTDMGAVTWHNDHVKAGGTIFDAIAGHNEADLSFNYELHSQKTLELEILHYTKGPNWVDIGGRANTVSHLGVHCSEEELHAWRLFFSERNIGAAQDVITDSHTNPVITGQRRYRYVVFDTKDILGVDLKFIVRLNQDGSPYL